MNAHITLYDADGDEQSSGLVMINAQTIALGRWVLGGAHIGRTPIGLIRRIARHWADDGGDRCYSGIDDATGVQFQITPTS
jgi:hypothetical protein